MRYKSIPQDGYTIYAVAGTDVVSFGIDFSNADTAGLLGFSVERHDIKEGEKYFMKGFKVFKDVVPNPTEDISVSTYEQPVQSFVWDDFTAKPDHEYEYSFYPVKGKPKFLDHKNPVSIRLKTEGLFTNEKHDVFFNRGVASSQAYARRFSNLPPDKIRNPELQKEAFQWLSRDLKDAFYKFIDRAQDGDALYGSFYEFHYLEAVKKFKDAIDRGVEVHLIIDCKQNESTDKEGVFHEAFPRETNLRTLNDAGIDESNFIQRTANKSSISHNKFLVFQPKGSTAPTEVWTGSTNISEGGIFGQTNVGHWIRDSDTAQTYKEYWELLSTDPGSQEGSEQPKKENAEFKAKVEKITKSVTFEDIATGETIIPVFSPRAGGVVLDTYFELVDKSKEAACITLAFGVNAGLKEKLIDNTFKSSIVFMLLEKKDAPASRSKNKDSFVFLNAKNNVYEAYGSYIEDPLYRWTRETNTQRAGLNTHVKYIHTKFLLGDPLSDTPIVVTGSANFSKDSTNDNDENMVIIKNDLRVADIYFTEFNRLFNHYYFRSLVQDMKQEGKSVDDDSLFLAETDAWLEKYKTGKLRRKRLDLYRNMKGAIILE